MAVDCTRGQREKQNAIDDARRAIRRAGTAYDEATRSRTSLNKLTEKVEALEAEVAKLRKQLLDERSERTRKNYGVFKLRLAT